MRRIASLATAAVMATVLLAGCASGDSEPAGPEGPNGYTLAGDLGEGHHLWWDRSPESGLTDIIATGPDAQIVGSCLGTPGDVCFVGPQTNRMGLVIADPAAERSVIHFYGQDVEFVAGDAPGDEDPAVFGVRLPEDRPNPDAGWSIELFDASGAAVPLG